METGNWNRKSSEFLNPRKTSSLPPDPPRRRLTEPRSEHAGPTRSPVKDHADESSYVRGAERRDCHRDPGGNVRPNQEKRRAYSGQLSTGRMPCLLPRIPPRRGTRPQGRAVSFPYATPHVTTLMGRISLGGRGGADDSRGGAPLAQTPPSTAPPTRVDPSPPLPRASNPPTERVRVPSSSGRVYERLREADILNPIQFAFGVLPYFLLLTSA